MLRVPRYLLALSLSGAVLLAQNPCGTPAANRDITGTWIYSSNQGEEYVFATSGGTTTLSTPLDSTLFNEGFTFTFVSTDGTTYIFNNSYRFLSAGGATGTAVVKFTLSPDGNTLSVDSQGNETENNGAVNPFHNTFQITRQTGTATLVPSTVQEIGTEGGNPVTDSTTLSLYNCGSSPSIWQASVTQPWLSVKPTSGTLSPLGSIVLTLIATPGSLKALNSPFTDTVTVSAQNPGDFGPATTAVQFKLTAGKDALTPGAPTPSPGTNLETLTNLTFSVPVTGTLNSAASGNLFVQLLSDAGTVLQAGPTTPVKQGAAFNQTLSLTTQIPSGTLGAKLQVVMQPATGTSTTADVGGLYPVYERAQLSVFSANALWGPPAALNGLSVLFNFTGANPQRKTVKLNIVNEGFAVVASDQVAVNGTSAYSDGFTGLTLPSLAPGQNVTWDVNASLPASPGADEIDATYSIIVSAPPAITSFMLSGQDGNFVPASQAITFTGSGTTQVQAQVAYAQLQASANARVVELDKNGAVIGQGQSYPAQTGSHTIQLNSPVQAVAGDMFRVDFANAAGQTVSTAVSVTESQESLVIETACCAVAGGNMLIPVDYSWAGSSQLIASYGGGSTSPCAPLATVTGVVRGSCTIPFDPKDSNSLVDVTVYVQHADGSHGLAQTRPFATPATLTFQSGTTVAAGPVKITPSQSGPPVTARNLLHDLGQDVAALPSPPANAGAVAGVLAEVRTATGGISGTPVAPNSLVFASGDMNFSPSIPSGGGFTTQIVYQYSTALLPDDPGFNPANLELVSYDPSTGQLLTYPSTVDTAGRTVTATVAGLAPYYALAVPVSTLGTALNLPLDPSGQPAPAGISVFNAATIPANVAITARGPDSTLLAGNPTAAAVLPGQQAASSFDSLGAAISGKQGWIQTYADVSSLTGAALLNESLGGWESVPFVSGSTSVVLPGIELAAGQNTEFDLANVTPFSNSVQLQLRDLTGRLAGQLQVDLPAKGSFSASVEAVFGASAPFQGYLLVSGQQRLAAAAITRIGGATSALSGQPLTVGSASTTALYVPHFQIGGGISARLDLVNPTAVDAHVSIQANKDDGTLLAKSVSVTIKSGTQYWSELATAFGLDPKQPATGSITVTSDLGGLVGDVTFGDSASPVNHRTSIALAPGMTSSAIPDVVNTTALPMTVVAMNAGSGTANVKITILKTDGTVAGSVVLSIPPGGRFVQKLTQIAAAAAGQTGGAIQINSDQPVAALALLLPASPVSDFAAIPAAASSLNLNASGPAPQINGGGISNAAAAKTTLARGGLATIYGSNFMAAGGSAQAGVVPFPLSLGGVSVTVGGIPAPLYYVNPGQINFQVPFEVPANTFVSVVVIANGVPSPSVSVSTADYALGVFSYFRTSTANDPIVVHLDNSFVTPSNPAAPGETVVVYATGIGKLNNAPKTGAGASSSPLSSAVDTPLVTVGGATANVIFAGLTPGGVGLAQLDVTLPNNLATGSLPMTIQFPGDTAPSVNLAVKGNAQSAPVLTLSATSLAFGNVNVGQTKDLTVTISNTGTASLNVSSLTPGAGFSVVAPSAPFTVASGASQTVTVRFSPASAGVSNGALLIVSNDAASPATVSLSGTGVAVGAPAISVAPPSLSFGTLNVGQSSALTLSVGNTGTAPLTVSSLSATAGYSVVSPSTPFTVAAGAAATTVTVRFSPTAAGPADGSLTISSNDPSKGNLTIPLTGSGTTPTPLACGYTLGADIYAKWTALGGSGGLLGCPSGNETEAAKSPQGTTGRTATFSKGLIYWHRDGAFAGQAYELHSCTVAAYTATNLSGGIYGFPVSDQYAVDGGYRNDFQAGYILGAAGLNICSNYVAGADLTGGWNSDRGQLTLVQDSFNITGTYGNQGTVTGTISGSIASVTWQDASGQGLANFILSSDAKSFTGSYAKQGSGTNSPWNGTRVAGGTVGWFAPGMLNFGTVPTGQSRTLNIVATAEGSPLSIIQFTSDNSAFKITVGAFTVLPGGSTTVPIRFTPNASGVLSGNITISTLDPARPSAIIKVTGIGQ